MSNLSPSEVGLDARRTILISLLNVVDVTSNLSLMNPVHYSHSFQFNVIEFEIRPLNHVQALQLTKWSILSDPVIWSQSNMDKPIIKMRWRECLIVGASTWFIDNIRLWPIFEQCEIPHEVDLWRFINYCVGFINLPNLLILVIMFRF